jgi:hypothetical protein
MAEVQVLTDLTAEVENTTGVMASATLALGGVEARIQAAVDAAIQGGATAAQLAPVQAEVDARGAARTALAAAIAASPGTTARRS